MGLEGRETTMKFIEDLLSRLFPVRLPRIELSAVTHVEEQGVVVRRMYEVRETGIERHWREEARGRMHPVR